MVKKDWMDGTALKNISHCRGYPEKDLIRTNTLPKKGMKGLLDQSVKHCALRSGTGK